MLTRMRTDSVLIQRGALKGQFTHKNNHYLRTLKLFQMCKNVFVLMNNETEYWEECL